MSTSTTTSIFQDQKQVKFSISDELVLVITAVIISSGSIFGKLFMHLPEIHIDSLKTNAIEHLSSWKVNLLIITAKILFTCLTFGCLHVTLRIIYSLKMKISSIVLQMLLILCTVTQCTSTLAIWTTLMDFQVLDFQVLFEQAFLSLIVLYFTAIGIIIVLPVDNTDTTEKTLCQTHSKNEMMK